MTWNQLIQSLDPETTAKFIGAVGGVTLAFLGALWRYSRQAHANAAVQRENAAAVLNLAGQIAAVNVRLDRFVDAVTVTGQAVNRMQDAKAHGDKDMARLEGRLEQLSSAIMASTATMHQTTSSLDAVWRVLQTLHPQAVPKRASDRG